MESLHRDAQAALRDGRLREAHRHCLAILEADRHHADAWFLCALIAARNGRHAKALEVLENALRLSPRRAEYRAEQGKLLLSLRRPREALAAAREALIQRPTDSPTLNTLGTVLSHCGEHEQALACFERAAHAANARSTEHRTLPAEFCAELHFNLATSLQFAGRFDEAVAACAEAVRLRPHDFRAHAALAALRRTSPDDSYLERLETLRGEARTSMDRLYLGHAIAREQENLGRHEQALASLAWAKEGRARETGYTPEQDADLFASIRRLFDASFFQSCPADGCDSAEPIFIVGMPRSGTTLVEQILGSHPAVFAAGELQNFPHQVKHLAGTPSPDVLDTPTLEVAARTDLSRLGEAYLQSTRPRTGHTPHFIDKLPHNFLYLGLIRRALPRARIICLRRDPMDTCLSNYRQLFATQFRYYHYNYELLDCGRYYIEFDRLMRHWQELMEGAIYELQYEALVADPPQQTAQLLRWCGLPWDEACLAFNERRAAVATPSAAQVRQGIYDSAVGRWRYYGDAVQPLYELLREAGFYD
ncbi:MAG: sulfotransferase [Halioglobus sp.]|nr:sulfotransferase [Halioglobus sp.]